CIDVSNTSGVSIDCGNHTITDIPGVSTMLGGINVAFTNTQNSSLSNCRLNAWNAPLVITSGTNIVIQNSRVYSTTPIVFVGVHVKTSSNIRFTGNNFRSAIYMIGTSNSMIDNNILVSPVFGSGNTTATVVRSTGGTGNQFLSNLIDGLAVIKPGASLAQSEALGGADDAIVLIDEYNSVIDKNTMVNFFDAAVEGAGFIDGARITNNVIQNTSYTAIGGWWDGLKKQSLTFKMRNSVVTGNRISNAVSMFAFPQKLSNGYLAITKVNSESTASTLAPTNQFANNSFGVVIVDTPTQSYIKGLYSSLFKRTADPGGLDYWVAQSLAGSQTCYSVAKNFIESEEIRHIRSAAISGNLEVQIDYLNRLYLAILGRPADTDGFIYWRAQLQSGYPIVNLETTFLESTEFQNRCANLGLKYRNSTLNVTSSGIWNNDTSGTYAPSKAADKSNNTRWASNNDGRATWIQIDLAAYKFITSATIKWESAGSYKVEVSLDGVTYARVGGGFANFGTTTTLNLANNSYGGWWARYVRISPETANEQQYRSIYEITLP
ncbi:MAG: DUF4214 domain-containing protein, partial [Pseudobdellovibrionaceae bacterium]